MKNTAKRITFNLSHIQQNPAYLLHNISKQKKLIDLYPEIEFEYNCTFVKHITFFIQLSCFLFRSSKYQNIEMLEKLKI